MTERLCSPLHSRARTLRQFHLTLVRLTRQLIIVTSELMFELYSVPSLAYCNDGIMSFYRNHLPPPNQPFSANGLVISFNTASTSVIPILRGKGLLNLAKRCVEMSQSPRTISTEYYRIPWGPSQSSEYLLKLIQLKYPTFPTRVTTMQTNVNLCTTSLSLII